MAQSRLTFDRAFCVRHFLSKDPDMRLSKEDFIFLSMQNIRICIKAFGQIAHNL